MVRERRGAVVSLSVAEVDAARFERSVFAFGVASSHPFAAEELADAVADALGKDCFAFARSGRLEVLALPSAKDLAISQVMATVQSRKIPSS